MPSSLIRNLSRRLGLRVFRLFARPLRAGPVPLPSDTLDLRLLERREAIALCGKADLDLHEERVTAAYVRGDFCVAAFDGRELAGYCWFAFAPLPHLDGVWVRFTEDVAWTYKSFVRPSYRGRRIAPRLYRFADVECKSRGRAQSVICVEAHNAPSIAAALRAGFERAGRASYLRNGRMFIDWSSSALRNHAVSFFLPGQSSGAIKRNGS